MGFILSLIVFVVFPSALNVFLLFRKPIKGVAKVAVFILEVIYIIIGTELSSAFCDATSKDWWEAVYIGEHHSLILTEAMPTFMVLMVLAFAGCIVLKFIDIDKMPPIVAVLCISAIYMGIAEIVMGLFQVSKNGTPWLYILPINLIIIFIRAIKDAVIQKMNSGEEKNEGDSVFKKVLDDAKTWPLLALVLSVPFLGIVVILLTLFGQRPDNVIRMWTETADWTFSTKIPPEPLPQDMHYLCTVAAGGHRKVVKPLRTGIRHGHKILVNRQLMIANAFEQLIQERLPRFHKVVRTTYDTVGYPIAKHIHSPYVADVVYFIMKPLEWLFLIVLYLFDVKPENRIAVQYPHSKPPQTK